MAKKLELDLNSLPVTRGEARELGIKWFFTRKRCRRGHLAARPVSSATCMECHAEDVAAKYVEDPQTFIDRAIEHQRQLKEDDPESFLEYGRKKTADWRARNPERHLTTQRNWQTANRDTRNGQARTRYSENLQHHRKKKRRWRQANPEKVAASYREWCRKNPTRARIKDQIKRARRLGAPGVLTEKDLNRIRKLQSNNCVFCQDPLSEVGETIEHFIALVCGGTNHPVNIGLACPSCNFRKWKKDAIEFCMEQGFYCEGGSYPLCPWPRRSDL